MNYRGLGRSGLRVSEISFGSWVTFGNQIDTDAARACMVAAYDAGVNFFDNAEAYAGGKSELVMGELLAELGWPRDSYIVSSKVFFGAKAGWPTYRGLSFKHVREACDQALGRLRVDYLDLYFCHRADPATPIEETCWAMHQLVMAGKVLYWGTSMWSADEIMEAHAVCARLNLVPPVMEQPVYHMLERRRLEAEYVRLFERVGLGTTIWSPLAQGILTGKYNDVSMADVDGRARPDQANISQWIRPMLEGEAGARTLAVCRGLKLPNVSTAIMGATRASQVEENVKAGAAVAKLTDDVMDRIETLLSGHGFGPGCGVAS